jgi:hypothetical protein
MITSEFICILVRRQFALSTKQFSGGGSARASLVYSPPPKELLGCRQRKSSLAVAPRLSCVAIGTSF